MLSLELVYTVFGIHSWAVHHVRVDTTAIKRVGFLICKRMEEPLAISSNGRLI